MYSKSNFKKGHFWQPDFLCKWKMVKIIFFSLLDNNDGADFLWHEFSKLLKGVVILMYDIQMSGLPYALHLVFLKKSRVAYHRQWRRQNKGFSYNSLYFNTEFWSEKNILHTCYSLAVYICYRHSKSKFCVNYPVPKKGWLLSKRKMVNIKLVLF